MATIPKKRIDEIDIVKGIGIIYVFMRHLCELTGVSAYGPEVFSVFDCSTEAVMFMFIFLSGYVFKSKGNIGLDIRNKCRQLLVPYLLYCTFFSVTYFIRYILFGDMSLGLFVRNVLSNYLAKPNLDIPVLGTGSNVMRYAVVPFWYISEIFMAFMVFIVISKCLETKKIYARIIAAACLLLVSALLMRLDVRGMLTDLYSSKASYFAIFMNTFGFAGLLMIGTILRHFRVFDMDEHSKRFNVIMFSVCLVFSAVQSALYSNEYALQYGKWGQNGILSIIITPLTGFAITYCLVFIARFLKRISLVKKTLLFLGAHTLDILLLHFGIGELICMIFGFWVPIYDMSYPSEIFAWWHFAVVVVLTAAIILGYLLVKNKKMELRKIRKA